GKRESGRGAFPPIPRPAVSSVVVAPEAIRIVSRAASSEPPSPPLLASFRKTAMLSATFTSPPRLVEDLNRLLGVKVAALLGGGGAIALYDVEVGKLLPRPIGVFAVPGERRADFNHVVHMAPPGQAPRSEGHTAEPRGH